MQQQQPVLRTDQENIVIVQRHQQQVITCMYVLRMYHTVLRCATVRCSVLQFVV